MCAWKCQAKMYKRKRNWKRDFLSLGRMRERSKPRASAPTFRHERACLTHSRRLILLQGENRDGESELGEKTGAPIGNRACWLEKSGFILQLVHKEL